LQTKHRRPWVLTFLFLLSFGLSYAQRQEVNSLLLKIKGHPQEDTVRVNLLSQLSFNYHTIWPDSTIYYGLLSLELSKKIGYSFGIASAYKHLAIGEYVLGNRNEALLYSQNAVAMFRESNDEGGLAAIFNNMAIIFHNEGKHEMAKAYYDSSLVLRIKTNHLVGMADSYNNLGNLCTDQDRYSEALDYLFKALRLREKIGDNGSIGNSYSNIASVYYYLRKMDAAFENAQKAYRYQEKAGNQTGMMQSLSIMGNVCNENKRFEKALVYYKKGLELSKKAKNADGLSLSYKNMGDVYYSFEDYNQSESYFRISKEIDLRLGDIHGLSNCELGIGRALLKKGEVERSISYLQNAFEMANSIGNKTSASESAFFLALAFEKNKNYVKSLEYTKKLISLKDSLYNIESVRNSNEQEYRYVLEKKQNEISILEKDKSIQEGKIKLQVLYTTALFVLVGLLLLFIYFINYKRVKEKEMKELITLQKDEIEAQAIHLNELNLFKTKTFSILSHDLRGPISSFITIFDLLDNNDLNDEEFKMLIEKLRIQLKSINILLDNTLNWSKTQMRGELSPQKEQVKVIEFVTRNFDLFKDNAEKKQLLLENEIGEEMLVCVDPNHLDIILRNIIFNAIKFAKVGGKVLVKALKVDANHIEIRVIDNGIGMTPEFVKDLFSFKSKSGDYGTGGEPGAGIGLILTKDFIERNLGGIRVESKEKEGSTFIITFPLN
jgi:signal transduction histidine kinase